MKRSMPLILFVFWLILLSRVFSQFSPSLYLPREVQRAVEKRTRTLRGVPGDAYWQNRADYRIQVTLHPDSGLIEGSGQVVYYNNSPDSLHKLVFRLYPNIYARGNPRQFPIPPTDLTEGMDILSIRFMTDRTVTEVPEKSIHRTPTNLVIKLEQLLTPGDSIKMEFRWKFVLPYARPIRMGRYSDTEFFVAYWYPQVAVYDDVNGWDMREYTGVVEFYNDFNNYDVRITVPGDYVVWATGELENAGAVLRPSVVQRYRQAMESDTVVHIISPADYRKGRPTLEGEKHTWHFVARHVTDFSFATSNRYNWDGVSLVVDRVTGRRVLTDVAYPDSAAFYQEAAMFARATVEYLSFELPGVPFPYPHITTFCNGTARGGMETPMMTNDGIPRNRHGTIGLVFHEIAHTYFPFYMGINERKYAWMDEGWASFFPREVVERLEPDYDYWAGKVKRYIYGAGYEWDVPLRIPSYLLNPPAYRMASYNRSAVAYALLLEYLGRERFRAALQEYIRRWHGKHPLPIDFFATFNEVAREDLSWFWKPWFFELGYPDLAVTDVQLAGDSCRIFVRRQGMLPIPVELTLVFQDSTTRSIRRPISVWKTGNREWIIREKISGKLCEVRLGGKYIPDVNAKNDRFRIRKE